MRCDAILFFFLFLMISPFFSIIKSNEMVSFSFERNRVYVFLCWWINFILPFLISHWTHQKSANYSISTPFFCYCMQQTEKKNYEKEIFMFHFRNRSVLQFPYRFYVLVFGSFFFIFFDVFFFLCALCLVLVLVLKQKKKYYKFISKIWCK